MRPLAAIIITEGIPSILACNTDFNRGMGLVVRASVVFLTLAAFLCGCDRSDDQIKVYRLVKPPGESAPLEKDAIASTNAPVIDGRTRARTTGRRGRSGRGTPRGRGAGSGGGRPGCRRPARVPGPTTCGSSTGRRRGTSRPARASASRARRSARVSRGSVIVPKSSQSCRYLNDYLFGTVTVTVSRAAGASGSGSQRAHERLRAAGVVGLSSAPGRAPMPEPRRRDDARPAATAASRAVTGGSRPRRARRRGRRRRRRCRPRRRGAPPGRASSSSSRAQSSAPS